MTSHPNRGWRGRWTVDREKNEARHGPSGLVVCFVPTPDEPGAWDGQSPNAQEIADALTQAHGVTEAARMLARLLREAGDIFSERRRDA